MPNFPYPIYVPGPVRTKTEPKAKTYEEQQALFPLLDALKSDTNWFALTAPVTGPLIALLVLLIFIRRS